MIRCPDCNKDIPSGSSDCPSCGALIDGGATQLLETPPSARTMKHSSSFDSIDDSRFAPGTMLADRYRIVGLLGKGGMGEVYRADDLKLGQPVALKFLPDRLLRDGASLARFHREVRVARQVSHKNVCRVYDIGETNGQHFLSMEFIKGEELSSLLRRIGRLPSDKAIQIARQICAGLAAAHDSGVLHRDLKPSNIMIDGDGNARVLDFGLAGLAEDFKTEERSAGTPAYMAPEQIAGKEVTVRSDIYSLGLVFYELFTGKRAYDAGTLGELMKLRLSDTTPTTPSEIVKDIDPVIDRVIDRCIQKDPLRRPASALEVAAALPGGDPIAAALAAGETPSPEMVAAAPKEGALRPAVAMSMFVAFLVGLALVTMLADKVVLYGYVPLEKSPDVLRENARDIIRSAGVVAPPTDFMSGFTFDLAPLEHISRTDARPNRWQDLKDGQPATIIYWFRQSPNYLADFDYFRDHWTDPSPTMSGMSGVKLDTRGRLLSFYAVPPQIDPVPGLVQNNDTQNPIPYTLPQFATLFKAAGLDIANFKPTPSQWVPLYVNDTRVAWEGLYPEQPNVSIRVEAASYRGKPVHFEIVEPWDKPERQEPPGLSKQFQALFTIMLTVFVLVLVGSIVLAFRNLRLGRGDWRGAWRLAVFVFILTQLTRLFSAHHIPTFGEFGTVLNGLQDSLFAGAFFWVVYLALEPSVRKRWPGRIISWSRLLAGDFRDPLVARDILIGGVVGIGITLWQLGVFFVRSWLSDLALKPPFEPAAANLGLGGFVAGFSNQLTSPLLNAFLLLFLILLLAMLFRRDWLGFLVGWLVFLAALAFLGGGSIFNWASAAVTAGLITFVLLRYGLLAMVFTIFFLQIYISFPVTTNLTAWYATGFVLDLILMLILVFYAFRTSLAGQSVFSGKLLED
jgi:eukaryotic-like serine/threonine-protein kinase